MRFTICKARFILELTCEKSYKGIARGKRLVTSGSGKKLQVSRQTVNAIETERYDPGLQLAFKIGSVFDLPVEEIFFRDEKKIKRTAGIRIY